MPVEEYYIGNFQKIHQQLSKCSFVEHRSYKVIYRRYASLYFIIGLKSEQKRNSQPCFLNKQKTGNKMQDPKQAKSGFYQEQKDSKRPNKQKQDVVDAGFKGNWKAENKIVQQFEELKQKIQLFGVNYFGVKVKNALWQFISLIVINTLEQTINALDKLRLNYQENLLESRNLSEKAAETLKEVMKLPPSLASEHFKFLTTGIEKQFKIPFKYKSKKEQEWIKNQKKSFVQLTAPNTQRFSVSALDINNDSTPRYLNNSQKFQTQSQQVIYDKFCAYQPSQPFNKSFATQRFEKRHSLSSLSHSVKYKEQLPYRRSSKKRFPKRKRKKYRKKINHPFNTNIISPEKQSSALFVKQKDHAWVRQKQTKPQKPPIKKKTKDVKTKQKQMKENLAPIQTKESDSIDDSGTKTLDDDHIQDYSPTHQEQQQFRNVFYQTKDQKKSKSPTWGFGQNKQKNSKSDESRSKSNVKSKYSGEINDEFEEKDEYQDQKSSQREKYSSSYQNKTGEISSELDEFEKADKEYADKLARQNKSPSSERDNDYSGSFKGEEKSKQYQKKLENEVIQEGSDEFDQELEIDDNQNWKKKTDEVDGIDDMNDQNKDQEDDFDLDIDEDENKPQQQTKLDYDQLGDENFDLELEKNNNQNQEEDDFALDLDEDNRQPKNNGIDDEVEEDDLDFKDF